jgi:hypothetical protein
MSKRQAAAGNEEEGRKENQQIRIFTLDSILKACESRFVY